MKILKYKYILSAALLSTMLGVTSCVNDLDTVPLDKDELVSDVVFGKEIGAYEQSLAKIYAGLVIGGNAGGDSDRDVVGIDGGSQASFIRVLWNMQELASDIAHCCWNDPGIPDFNHISWAHIIVCIIRLTCQMRFYVKQLMINLPHEVVQSK